MAAALEIMPQLTALRAKVLGYIRTRPDGATDIEIQAALEMDGSTQRPRRIELQKMGYIIEAGQRIPPGKRRASAVWKVKEFFRQD
jgi:hypothetical protein